jgi:hypothetical protein
VRLTLAAAVAALAALAPPVAAAVPRVDQMVVFRDGSAHSSRPAMGQTTVKVGARRCAVASATPLAALVRSGEGPLSLKDYGACSKRPSDGGGLFVAAIGADRNKGSDGWVYKAGNVLGTAGAADPTGPLGRGRLKSGTNVTWFWCHVTTADRGCPQTLVVSASPAGAGALVVKVRRYDDRGKRAAAAGALVHAGGETATADASGLARFTLPAGRRSVWAEQTRRIRSFAVVMNVK